MFRILVGCLGVHSGLVCKVVRVKLCIVVRLQWLVCIVISHIVAGFILLCIVVGLLSGWFA